MIVIIDKTFDKDLQSINVKTLKTKVLKVIFQIQKAQQISDISNIKKIKGHKSIYRIRLGNFRIGAIIQRQNVELIRILHRKDIYKYFP